MTREQFLYELESYLSVLPYNDKEDAMNYYREYTQEILDDGGSITERLGSPRQVADEVLGNQSARNVGNDETENETKKQGKGNVWLYVVLGIFAAPILIPIAIAFISVLFAILVTAFALIFALAISGVAVTGGAIFSMIFGVISFFGHPGTGLFLTGLGMVGLGVGLLLTLGGIALIKLFIRACKIYSEKVYAKKHMKSRKNAEAEVK